VARINIEDSIFKDQRFINLMFKLGSLEMALGSLVRAWMLAQKWFLSPEKMIPISDWKTQGIKDEIIEVGLATQIGEKIRLSGSDAQFGWLMQCSAAGKKGGPAAAMARAENIKESERRGTSGHVGSRPLTLTPSPSPSPSLSQAHSQKLKTIAQQVERVYQELYPRKEGKTRGMKRLARQIKNETHLAEFEKAVRNYAEKCEGRDTEYIKQFSTFASEWREWIDVPKEKSWLDQKMEEINCTTRSNN
jgi:hypothetical protein